MITFIKTIYKANYPDRPEYYCDFCLNKNKDKLLDYNFKRFSKKGVFYGTKDYWFCNEECLNCFILVNNA